MNSETTWVEYDAATTTATVTGPAGFVASQKSPSKDVGAFDGVDRAATENLVLGLGEDGLHFATASRGDDRRAVTGSGRTNSACGVRRGPLRLEATASDAESLDAVTDVVGRHLQRFGERDELHVTWVREQTDPRTSDASCRSCF